MESSMIPNELLRSTCEFLFRLLKETPVIPYSYFYDGTDRTRNRLIQGVGISESDADWYGVEALVDDVVVILDKNGFVEQRILEEKLADGQPAYEIRLADKGRRLIASGRPVRFPDLETHI
jgi:hypothetical protein